LSRQEIGKDVETGAWRGEWTTDAPTQRTIYRPGVLLAPPARPDPPLDRHRHPRLPGRPRASRSTATEWVALLADAQRAGRLDTELDRSSATRC
jgi:hypothetical protein